MEQTQVLALIAEMKAKLAQPNAGELTVELATITLQAALPYLDSVRHPRVMRDGQRMVVT